MNSMISAPREHAAVAVVRADRRHACRARGAAGLAAMLALVAAFGAASTAMAQCPATVPVQGAPPPGPLPVWQHRQYVRFVHLRQRNVQVWVADCAGRGGVDRMSRRLHRNG